MEGRPAHRLRSFNLSSHSLRQTIVCERQRMPFNPEAGSLNSIPYRQVRTLKTLPTMKTLPPLVNRLQRSPAGVTAKILYTNSVERVNKFQPTLRFGLI